MEKYLEITNNAEIPNIQNSICPLDISENDRSSREEKLIENQETNINYGRAMVNSATVNDGLTPCKIMKKEPKDIDSSTDRQFNTIIHWNSQNLDNNCHISRSCSTAIDIGQSSSIVTTVCSMASNVTPCYNNNNNNVATVENEKINICSGSAVDIDGVTDISRKVSSGVARNTAAVRQNLCNDAISEVPTLIPCSNSNKTTTTNNNNNNNNNNSSISNNDNSISSDTTPKLPKLISSPNKSEIVNPGPTIPLISFDQSEQASNTTELGLNVSKNVNQSNSLVGNGAKIPQGGLNISLLPCQVSSDVPDHLLNTMRLNNTETASTTTSPASAFVPLSSSNCGYRSIHRRDHTPVSHLLPASKLDSLQKENSPLGILNGMQGIVAPVDHHASSQETFSSIYGQQSDNNIILVTQSPHHLEPLKVSQTGNQIVHTPISKASHVIYCHNVLNNGLPLQLKTPTNSLNLNSSGEENNSPPENLSNSVTSFKSPNNTEDNMVSYNKTDQTNAKEDDPSRHQHNLNERKRRARITIACDLMRRLVPGLSDKTDKATVFEYAARYIYFLQSHVGTDYDRNFLVKYSPY
ncbi:putative mediator of RNA polymerase II transcription subunit 26 isoform X1 [Octopus vulgaris]|uniref:Mediator of RNA polymerase II transcription subunit 26 isoform X1 n=1 Tax=Octopus vulgaris TaxID=6645 RepID=A0AA36AW58_OCTVU|nr:putative mediator of RNA polymerase II transcription subunit 26 isoform X1 [Octopus vulgaris]